MKARILVVEDDMDTARNLVRLLSKKGFDVQHAADGESAINACRGFRPKVVLVDGVLPSMTGIALGRALRALPFGEELALVMIASSFRGGAGQRDPLDAGFDAAYGKPLPVVEMLAKIDELVEHGRPKPASPKRDSTTTRVAADEKRNDEKRNDEKKTSGKAPVEQRSAAAAFPPPSAARARVKTSSVTATSSSSSPSSASSTSRGTVERATTPGAPPSSVRPTSSLDEARAALDALSSPRPLSSSFTGLSAALLLARARVTGLLRLRHKSAILEVAFKNGVPVGAWDNQREHRLVERLLRAQIITPSRVRLIETRMRESGERFVEACLALGVFDEHTALEALDAQLVARVEAALFFEVGTAELVDDARAIDDLAQTPVDLVEVALRAMGRHPQQAQIDAFVSAHAGERFVAADALELHLPAIAAALPTSTLPPLFFAGPVSLSDVLARGEGALVELMAWHTLGLVREEAEPPSSTTLPVLLRADRAAQAFDLEAARTVREAFLKWQGRSHYDVLGVERDATVDEVRRAADARHAVVGRAAFRGRELGPASALWREVIVMIDDAVEVLTDDEARADYDLSLEGALAFPRATVGHALEEEILQGRIYLASGDVESAYDAFLRACALVPTDIDAIAYLGYAAFLSRRESDAAARAILESALDMNPHAIRPVFYLGQLAAREGRLDEARDLFLRAARRAPEDQEILTALAALDGAQA